MHYVRNANGSHARDPITLSKIRVENMYHLSGKPYDRKSLQTWVNSQMSSGRVPVVPHTGLPMKQHHINRLMPRKTYRQHIVHLFKKLHDGLNINGRNHHHVYVGEY